MSKSILTVLLSSFADVYREEKTLKHSMCLFLVEVKQGNAQLVSAFILLNKGSFQGVLEIPCLLHFFVCFLLTANFTVESGLSIVPSAKHKQTGVADEGNPRAS
jgi:hypothetical protein